MTHIYTGDGKGKTTAAVGLAIRAHGQGLNVLFAQFLKGGPTGELADLTALGIVCLRPPVARDFWWNLTADERDCLMREHNDVLRSILAELDGDTRPDLLVLDEFTYVYTTPMADRALCDRVLATARRRNTEIVITGRNAGTLADQADYLSDIHATRHPFNQGTPARKGIEF